MALPFAIHISDWAADLSSAVVFDDTIYGGANPVRNTLAVFLFLYKRDANSTDTAVSVDNSQPLTVTQWTFTLPQQDGLFVSQIMALNIWSAGTYAQNAAVHYQVDGHSYVANTSTSQTPGGNQWTLVTDYVGQLTGNTSVQQAQVYAWSDAHSRTGVLGDALADVGPKIRDGKCKNFDQIASILNAAAILESANVNFLRSNYITAQSIIDYLQAQTSLTV